MRNTIDKIEKYIQNNKFYISIYIIFFIICILTPISGDDYMNYVRGQQDIIGILSTTKEFYLTWEGRVVSRIIILIFTTHKFLWNIVTPFLFVIVFKSLLQNDKFKNKYSYYLLVMSILLVSPSMFAQSYTWLAGNITYFYPMALSIYYFSVLYNNLDNKLKINQIILLSILALIIPMFTENIGCAFVFGNFLLIMFNYYLKKKTRINWLFFIISALSLVLMLISPGSAVRANEEGVVNSYGLLEKIYINIVYYFTEYTITRHTFMLVLILVCCNIYCCKNKSKQYKIIFLILFNIIPALTIIGKFLNIKIVSHNLYYYPYLILVGVIFILSLMNSYKDDKKMLLYYMLLLLAAFSSILCMLVVGYWFDRISIFFVIVVSFISLKIIDRNIEINKDNESLIKMFFTISLIWIIFCMFSTYKIEKYRTRYVNEQKELKKECIEVIYNPSPYLWLSNLNGKYFVDTYKQYQKIDNEVELVLKRLSLKEYAQIIFD